MIRKLLVLSLMFTFALQAGQTGKIAGTVRDAATGEILAGVNIVIPELGLGGASDLSGRFFILNVPPGVYRVRVMMIGYTTQMFENVSVAMDQTAVLDVGLETEVLGMEEVRVESTRPAVVRDLSASQLYVREETIEELPIDAISSIVGLQAGVQGVSVRGGSSAQTAFIVDGFELNGGRSNTPSLNLSLSTVKEVQVQSGGFNAEYGNIRSGIINVITAEGSPSGYHGNLAAYYSPPTPKNFGISPYAPDSYYLRPYLDDAVAWTGTKGEPYTDVNGNTEWDPGEPFEDVDESGSWTGWDTYTQGQYSSFEGWNAVSLATLQDGDPNNDRTPTQAQQEFIWRHRRHGVIEDPEYTLDFGFGGPVPGLVAFGNTRFHLSHRGDRFNFVVPLSRDAYTSSTTRLKINTDVSSKLKLLFSLDYSEDRSVSPYSWTTTPTGSVLSSTYSVANLVSGGSNVVFMPGYYSPSDIYTTNFGVKLNHMLSQRSFYEVVYQYKRNQYNTFALPFRDTSRTEVVPGLWLDEAPYGYDPGEWMNLGRDSSVVQTNLLRGDYTWQMTGSHQLKAGLLLKHVNLQVRSFTDSDKDTWRREQIYDRPPFSLAAYLQDKLEYEGFIANVGVRGEYNDPNAPIYVLSPFDELYSQGLGANLEENASSKPARGFWTISPRLGISHPITLRSKLYFNYGHFYSEPASTYRFRIQRESNGKVTSIGNPRLKLERTVAYELGYSHSLSDVYLLNLATYYKDVTNQPGWVTYTSVDQSVNYSIAENNNYEDIRGLELTVSKLEGRWLTGFVNGTYMVRSSGYFGLTHYYQDPLEQRNFERVNPVESHANPTPYARANLVFHTPDSFGPRLAGFHPLADWRVSLLGSYRTGASSNYRQGEKIYRLKWRNTYDVTARLSRTVKSRLGDLELFMDVRNLLNTKWLSYTGFVGSRDYDAYRSSLHFPWEEGTQHGHDQLGDFRSWETDFVPLVSVDSLSRVEGTPGSIPVYYESSSGDYYRWLDATSTWTQLSSDELDEIMDTKAYIDMPNLRSMTFLNPRQITFGLRIKF